MNGTEKVVFDFAYITIHGTPGEDGRLQGYFDMMRIPYSCCGVLAAAITYDKFACNQYLKAFGCVLPDHLLLRQGQSVFRRRCDRKRSVCLVSQTKSEQLSFWSYKG